MPEKMEPDTIPFKPDGIDNVGPVGSDKFWEEIQNARILVGIGSVRNVKSWTQDINQSPSLPLGPNRGVGSVVPCSGSSIEHGRERGCGPEED
jgi:hypothetical protein